MASPSSSPCARPQAAQYLRMSREHQRYSLDNQAAAIADFAAARGLDIVRTYVDRGRSGLSVRRRDGLKQLLADALAGTAPFGVVLVYDVSRWGRFQEVDQAAYYEFLCRDAGVAVEYCAEPFANDGSLIAHMLKTLKRAGAAEFSRDLSLKVAAAQARGSAQGYWMGGEARYGFRRQLVDEQDQPICVLAPGQRKALQSQRVRLVLGPREEVEIVRRIFTRYAAGDGPKAIAAALRAESVPGWCGMAWSTSLVRRMIPDERYAGVWTYGASRMELGRGARKTPRSEWGRQPDGLPRIVDRKTWEAAQAVWRWRRRAPDERFMLQALQRILAQHGRLNRDLILATPATPTPHLYRKMFGDLTTAYRRVGYEPRVRRRLVGPYLERITTLVRDGKDRPPGQRPDAEAIYRLIRAEGFAGARVTVQREVGRIRDALACRPLHKLNWRSEDEILAELRALYEAHGYLTMGLIANHPTLPSLSALENHFGSFTQLYARVGCRTGRQKWRIGPYLGRIDELLRLEPNATQTAVSCSELHRQLVAEGFKGSYTTLRKHLVGMRARASEPEVRPL